jgi:DNA invertase Pin-like site-specific DNA recombinase
MAERRFGVRAWSTGRFQLWLYLASSVCPGKRQISRVVPAETKLRCPPLTRRFTTTRVALRARYSDDKQSPASIEDQFRICREHAAREKLKAVGTYHDAAISGASVIQRPGVQGLLQDTQRGKFDIILAEAVDCVSRDHSDVATPFKHLRFTGVRIVTLSEGEITELHVGLKGTMTALFLKDLGAKTHRGLGGRVERGKAGGELCYGYDVVKRTDSEGELIVQYNTETKDWLSFSITGGGLKPSPGVVGYLFKLQSWRPPSDLGRVQQAQLPEPTKVLTALFQVGIGTNLRPMYVMISR